ncbi:MAG: hypothetical protein DHS20C15_20810 [Planctomycetota bacterium]|nr:MAG: hypothetical protein DHS20C15_20810 [Planctomycetota bacterium]
MSRAGSEFRGVGLRLLAGGALLAVSLITVLVRSEVVAERYALRKCALRTADAQRRLAAGHVALQRGMQDLSTTGQQITTFGEVLD